jgi:2,4-dienoyl-CoA reductase-like NADH-dependent reductase (Old Yellow Enzyme family)
MMSVLFSESKIGSLGLVNRLIRTTSHEGLADNRGRPKLEQFEFYKGFIEGGIGLVITGYAGISQAGKSALYHMTMIDSDDLIPSHRKLVERVHEIGGKIVLQIAHCGRQTWSAQTGRSLLAPSAIPCGFYRERLREMTHDDIAMVIDEHGYASRRAKEAGYDGVQIHCAHGYLLSTFLSPHANKRDVQWAAAKKTASK